MKITLKIDGKDKTFINDFISARILREALKLNENTAEKKAQGTFKVTEQLDDLAELVVRAFGQQFSIDDLWDGLHSNEFSNEVTGVFNEILGYGGYQLKGSGDNEGK